MSSSSSVPSSVIVPDPSRAIVPSTARRTREIAPAGYSLRELPTPLRHLFAHLDAAAADGEIPLDLLRVELEQLDSGTQMFAPFWMFDACTYRRNLIRRTAAYEALLLCWLPGQRSPIHDHRGSGCAFRVIDGVVTETIYEHTKGSDLVCAASMRWLPPGTICASREFDIHEVANTQQADLVTLHVYSPPLADVNLYRAAESTPAS
jgi:cysteine dioxygenase